MIKSQKQTVAFYPYTRDEISYIHCMQSMIETEYNVIDYRDALTRVIPIEQISSLYLNWIEGILDDDDINFLNEAKQIGVKIIWVFHNRLPHDSENIMRDIEKMKYLIEIADVICVLSKNSIPVLKEYVLHINENKIVILPHQDFKGMYGYLKNDMLKDLSDDAEMTFACYGLIRPYKNLEIVVDAFKEFNVGKNCRLIIAGRSLDWQYANSLKELCNDHNILFVPEYIPSSMMGAYLNIVDVLILPYDLKSSMNSGAMIMAFSYERTVVCSNITMANDFDEALLYKYDYLDEKQHKERLIEKMQEAYLDGKQVVHNKGVKLYHELEHTNQKKDIKELVCSIVHSEREVSEVNQAVMNLIEERESLKKKFQISQKFEKIASGHNSIATLFLSNDIKKIALYGYGIYGKKIKKQLEKSGIEVEYIVDKRASEIMIDVPIYTLKDEIPKTEHLLITAVGTNYYEIHEKFNKNGQCSIYYLNELLSDIK